MEHIPILKVGRCLLVSIQFDMHDKLAMQLQDDLTQKLVATRARGVLIDISALDLVSEVRFPSTQLAIDAVRLLLRNVEAGDPDDPGRMHNSACIHAC